MWSRYPINRENEQVSLIEVNRGRVFGRGKLGESKCNKSSDRDT